MLRGLFKPAFQVRAVFPYSTNAALEIAWDTARTHTSCWLDAFIHRDLVMEFEDFEVYSPKRTVKIYRRARAQSATTS